MSAALPASFDPEFIVVCQSAWMNADGFGITYNWDGERFNNRNDAIKHGWKLRGSDDFNIAILYGDDLIWWGWMDQRIEEAEEDAAEIAEALNLTFDPRWYRLEYSKVTGKPLGATP
ncbi:hypothetical protein [Aureimonas sp. ME7]|uniref:hypothetical protein n=1 Tax=Aureimonas sp. ME7 TaxID=2744252 RepID=UPI0015F89864|nr:hypothetical protein [Aureimonas sp. ME7]